MFSIIEDCSPYFIRFTYNGIESIINRCKDYIQEIQFQKRFTHHRYPLDQATDLLSLTPVSSVLDINLNRVSLLVTNPGFYYRAHKDGMDHRYSINFTVEVLDDKCVTSWYSDEDLNSYIVDILPGQFSRECRAFDKSKHIPLKSMTAVQGECILFNTDIYHDFDNRYSPNRRMILTLRDKMPGIVYFENAREKLFQM